ncbi:MAG: tyrosine-protein phosphatase [Planctomycetes bacterium]|nr:tyrosine-protein phosphatase [Planctomycetota bacterium]
MPNPLVCWLIQRIRTAFVTASLFLCGYYFYRQFIRGNFHAVVPGQVYRCAEPSPRRLEELIRKLGIKTVLNLRRDAAKRGQLDGQRLAVERLGAKLLNFRLVDRALPGSPWLMRLAEAIETAPQPILMFCRRGADRSGLGAMMAAMALAGQDYKTAKRQMSAKFLHVREYPEYIHGVVLEYEEFCRRRGASTGGWREFRRWLFGNYRPTHCYAGIEAPAEVKTSPGRRVELPVTVVNRSPLAIPACRPPTQVALAAFLGEPHKGQVEKLLAAVRPLSESPIEPGQAVKTVIAFDAPTQGGTCTVNLDLIDADGLFFSEYGSPAAAIVVTVNA